MIASCDSDSIIYQYGIIFWVEHKLLNQLKPHLPNIMYLFDIHLCSLLIHLHYQILTDVSTLPVAAHFAFISKQLIKWSCALYIFLWHLPLERSHILIDLSSAVEMRYLPFVWKWMSVIQLSWPTNNRTHLPDLASNTRIFLSLDPVAT